MRIGIGQPAGIIPGVTGTVLLEWACRAEERGFSSLVFEDRLAWPGFDVLVSMAAAAAVTSRINLTTAILLAPLRSNYPQFAKQIASIDVLSKGRVVLGLGVGTRQDDYEEAGLDFHQRGKSMSKLLARTAPIWQGQEESRYLHSYRDGGPPLLFGGRADVTFQRIIEFGHGWISPASMGPSGFKAGVERVRADWKLHEKSGEPVLLGNLPRFALGPKGPEAVDAYLGHFYEYRGAAQRVAEALVTPEQVRERIAAFEEVGCEEVCISPCSADLEQVDLLADALGM